MKIVTPKEAMECCCPMGVPHPTVTLYCYGPDCMAWVWDRKNNPEFNQKESLEADRKGEEYAHPYILQRQFGHCGMVDRRVFAVGRDGGVAWPDDGVSVDIG